MQGNALSYLYSVEWPAFAVVAGIGWWQMVHDTPDDIAKRKAYHERMRAASVAVVARTLPRSARAITVGSEQVDGRRLEPGATTAAIEGQAADSAPGSNTLEKPSSQPRVTAPRMKDIDESEEEFQAILREAAEADDSSDPMTEYNRYLALLAVRGRAKTWRNPHGRRM